MGNNNKEGITWGGGTDEYGDEYPSDLTTMNYTVDELLDDPDLGTGIYDIDPDYIHHNFEESLGLLPYLSNEELVLLAKKIAQDFVILHDDNIYYYVTDTYIIPEDYGAPIPDELSNRIILEDTKGTKQRNTYHKELNQYFSQVEHTLLDDRYINYRPITEAYPLLTKSQSLNEYLHR